MPTAAGRIVELLVAASLLVVVTAVVDIARRPTHVLSRPRKASWIVAMVGGVVLFGVVGGAVALLYLLRVRHRLPAAPAPPADTLRATGAPEPPWIPAGWYPDPSGRSRLRWWDGKSWTGHQQV